MAKSKEDSILENQKEILKKLDSLKEEEDEILGLEENDSEMERKIYDKEKEELEELKKLEDSEEKILKEIKKDSALKRVTYRDITKGIIGAFFGIVGHFAFAKGVDLAADFTFARSTSLLVSSFIIVVLFLYFAGFRTVKDKFLFKFLPVRALVLYFSSIITVIIVLALYGVLTLDASFQEIYNTIAAVSVLAVLGACTADLIGKTEE